METITGTAGADTLIVLPGAVAVDGLAGNDVIHVNLLSGFSNLNIEGGGGQDSLDILPTAVANTLLLWVNLSTGELRFEAPDGSIHTQDIHLHGIESLYAGKGWRATLIGDDGDNLLVADTSAAFGSLVGGAGNDTLQGYAADYSQTAGPVHASLQTQTATSVDGNDTLLVRKLIGSAFNDVLTGGGGLQCELDGGAGDDTLTAGFGVCVMAGGPGNDTLIGLDRGASTATYAQATSGVTVNLAQGVAQGGGLGSDTLVNIGRIVGSAFADNFVGSSLDDAFFGAGGADTAQGGDGNDLLYYGVDLDGGSGNDRLRAAPVIGGQRSSLQGGAGDDTLVGGAVLLGGAGNDRFEITGGYAGLDWAVPFSGTTPTQQVDGGDGFDMLGMRQDDMAAYEGRSTHVTINLADGTVRINDGAASYLGLHSIEGLYDSKGWDTTFLGDAADNWLQGDWLVGRGGNDTLQGGTADYSSTLGAVQASLALHIAFSVDGVDSLAVAGLVGSAFDDILQGDDAPNTIDAGPGNDVILGGAGADHLAGGDGNDGFIGMTDGDTIDGGAGIDTLYLSAPCGEFGFQGGFSSRAGIQLIHFNEDDNWREDMRATLVGIERFVFSDCVLATGNNAVSAAKLLVPLWGWDSLWNTPAVGKAVDWFDHGHSWDESIRFALSFFTQQDDAQFAALLLANVPFNASGYTQDSLLALMASHGGKGSVDGRAYITNLMAHDANSVAEIALLDLQNTPLVCALTWGAEQLFGASITG